MIYSKKNKIKVLHSHTGASQNLHFSCCLSNPLHSDCPTLWRPVGDWAFGKTVVFASDVMNQSRDPHLVQWSHYVTQSWENLELLSEQTILSSQQTDSEISTTHMWSCKNLQPFSLDLISMFTICESITFLWLPIWFRNDFGLFRRIQPKTIQWFETDCDFNFLGKNLTSVTVR